MRHLHPPDHPMRALALIVPAALALTVPAAAQPTAAEVLRGAAERIERNVGGVRDYTLVLSAGGVRTTLYVFQGPDGWDVGVPGASPMGEMLSPLLTAGQTVLFLGRVPDGVLDAPVTLEADTVLGRPVHALLVPMSDGDDPEDRLRVSVDPATGQVVRARVGIDAVDEDGPARVMMWMTMDFADYRAADGLTVPRRMRLAFDVGPGLSEDDRRGMRAAGETERARLASDESAHARETRALIDFLLAMLDAGRAEMPVVVEEVRVDAGPPAGFVRPGDPPPDDGRR
jgi:hypothetical protein